MQNKIIVVYGGVSPEREVSIRSGKTVVSAARESGFEVEEMLINNRDDIVSVADNSIVLPILHGAYGEDGQVQRQLEQKNIQFLGSDSQVSLVCFDKRLTREALRECGSPIPEGQNVDAKTYASSRLHDRPHVLKAARGGSSIGTYIVRDPSKLNDKSIHEVFELDEHAVIENLVEGIEVTVSILGSRSLPIIEIRPPADSEFDYENKYNGRTEEICPPKSLDEATINNVEAIALEAHRRLGCRHLSRIDIIIDTSGRPFILDVNTMPGLTDQSLYPKSALAAGYTMPELVTEFIRMIGEDA